MNILGLVSVVLVAWSGHAASAQQDIDKGNAAYEAGNYATAFQEFKPLAEQGDAKAQLALGAIYLKGQGVPQNEAEALRWFKLAADQGHAFGQYALAVMYRNGYGVPQDYSEALKWLRLAAKQGEAEAQLALGSMYEKGQGLLQDFVRAHMWYNIAVANGSDEAVRRRDAMARALRSDDIFIAQGTARRCMESNYKNCGW
ncbi:tetratricopeptide repeat protein [Aestuariicoccus sp. MJ-SS9]|uniref:tetratricopeptide repeat protein n=1 Tax=Aestuariicoccus sp. MJ-SS9 TaxID=3079855 RepID=UPI002914F3E1|nr:tetratricopeptide repeat protein [Aestuariicoccus sp. MJ-SS9]MDU8913859.1 tetratricopeptide repeat protein [Aestuariicoccus sp. MJ-SS9]